MKAVRLNPKREMPVIGVKIMEEQFVDRFIKEGIVHFSSPSDWKDEKKKSGNQLDRYEGCFCYSTAENDECFKQLGRSFERIKEKDTFRYYEKNSRLKACCFYGINKSEFIHKKMRYGVREIDSYDARVQKTFFDKFNDQDKGKKKAILIFDMLSFFSKVTGKLNEMGCKEKDIYAFPVYYVDKTTPFVTKEPFPFEYFLKDSKFKEQSEFRILINCDDDSFWSRFTREQYNLALGDMSEITAVQDYYQEDLFFSIQGSSLIYNLATPEKTNIDEMPFSDIIGILYQTLQNQLPGEPISSEEIKTLGNAI